MNVMTMNMMMMIFIILGMSKPVYGSSSTMSDDTVPSIYRSDVPSMGVPSRSLGRRGLVYLAVNVAYGTFTDASQALNSLRTCPKAQQICDEEEDK